MLFWIGSLLLYVYWFSCWIVISLDMCGFVITLIVFIDFVVIVALSVLVGLLYSWGWRIFGDLGLFVFWRILVVCVGLFCCYSFGVVLSQLGDLWDFGGWYNIRFGVASTGVLETWGGYFDVGGFWGFCWVFGCNLGFMGLLLFWGFSYVSLGFVVFAYFDFGLAVCAGCGIA